MNNMLKAMQNISSRHYIKTLFDPVQTHAVYAVHYDDLEQVKERLREAGAKRLRVVKASVDLRIVCFKYEG